MKIAIFVTTLFVFTGSLAFADGYPFDAHTQAVKQDTIRLRLSEPQITALSATGVVTLADTQLALIQRFYPNAAKNQSVITATFNDNNEGLSNEDVYVFWVAAEEIAVTLNPKVITDIALSKTALTSEPHPNQSDIRIAPNGQIYIAGKPASLKNAFDVIVNRSTEPGLTHRQVDVCVAPPFRSSLYWHNSPDGQPQVTDNFERSVADLYTALTNYGEANNVIVCKSW